MHQLQYSPEGRIRLPYEAVVPAERLLDRRQVFLDGGRQKVHRVTHADVAAHDTDQAEGDLDLFLFG
jgi:hypothetical protein